MKNQLLYFSLIALFLACALPAQAQQINWRSLKQEDRLIAQVRGGWDYGMVLGLGLAYKFDTRMPMLLQAEYSFPSGKKLFDDLNTRLSWQAEFLQVGAFSLSGRVSAIYRQYHSPVVRMRNFGSALGLNAGIYKSRWYAAAECGFDKAILTHLKHSEFIHENYPAIRDGWYLPAGGNFNYGLQGGISFGDYDINLRVGKVISEHLKGAPLIPLYGDLGIHWHIR